MIKNKFYNLKHKQYTYSHKIKAALIIWNKDTKYLVSCTSEARFTIAKDKSNPPLL